MYHLRHQIFNKRLGWEVSGFGEMEIDGYDALGPHYVICERDTKVLGCMRLLPTMSYYMLKNTFPELLQGEPAPEAPDIYEISRFAVTDECCYHNERGISEITIYMLREAYLFAKVNQISEYVMVTTAAIERYLKRIGFKPSRLGEGKTIKIGIERSVALRLPIDALFARCVLAEDVEQSA
jgi:acyl homoserine lactone synthase